MNTLALWDTINQQVLNYPRADDQPVVNLDPRYLVLRIVKEARPDAPEGFTVQQRWTVDLDALEWRHGWELIELPTPAPAADWRTFKRVLLSHPEINSLLNGGIAAAPAAALSLPATLLNAAGGDVADFRSAWLSLRRLGLVSAELLQEVRALAISSNLPEAFVEALGGGVRPAAQYLGQEWMDDAGQLWRVEQSRGEDGQFLPDDPTTPERESLTWVEVTE
jgi:hypothetical protein